jgi:hypothetical protein
MEVEKSTPSTLEAAMNAISTTASLGVALRRELLRLARDEEDQAASEAATVPYWSLGPPSIRGHRVAAAILRAEADKLLTEH